jgi:hypothetical protein
MMSLKILHLEQTMSKLKNILKQMLNGFEHANAGENLTMRQKAAHLNNAPVYAKPVNVEAMTFDADAKSGRRRVALFMGSELPGEVMDYVIQTCANLKHDLTVITFQTENTARALLRNYEQALLDQGISMKLKALTGDPISRLSRYLKSHPEIAFLACKDTGYLAHRYINGPKDKNLLPVPVVVVVTKQGEAAQQLEKETKQGDKSDIKIA